MTLPGWRALAITWSVVLVLATGGVALLNHLGPLPQTNRGEAPRAEAGAEGTAEPAAAGPAAAPAPEAVARPPVAAEPPVAPAVASQPGEAAAPAPGALASPPPGAVQASPAAPTRTPAGEASAAPPTTARAVPGIDPMLTEAGPHGPLPRISADGRTPIRAYGRPFDRSDTRPRIAVIVGDFGLNASQSDDALRRLPAAVGLAVTPYGYGLATWSERARERGMETLVAIPMEPAGFPMNDPGDRALLTSLPMPENLDRLAWALSRTQGYVGAIGAIGGMRGERFAQAGEGLARVQDSLQSRGLLYIDPRPGARNPARAWGRAVDLVIDEPATRGEIERRLIILERLARERGSALALAGSPTPVVVGAIATWAETLAAKGLVLAPPSLLIRRPEGIAP